MKCYVEMDGGWCGAEATVLDLRRGFYVCAAHSPQAMTVAEFRRRLDLAHNQTEVRKLILAHQEHLTGTWKEITEVIELATLREMHFDGPAEGARPDNSNLKPQNPKLMTALAALLLLAVCPAWAGDAGTSNIQHPTSNIQVESVFQALAAVESGSSDVARGRVGEVSRYQITPSVWRRYTRLPLSAAVNPFTARNVAGAIMRDRVLRFNSSHGRFPGLREFYLLWNCPARVNYPHLADIERAARFETLVRSINHQPSTTPNDHA